jgi:AraC-like DNA-binding protein
MTILDVAYASGFNSKSTFNAAFKKIAGQTPGRFRSKPAETVLAVPRS